jgi:hypothetical protein
MRWYLQMFDGGGEGRITQDGNFQSDEMTDGAMND